MTVFCFFVYRFLVAVKEPPPPLRIYRFQGGAKSVPLCLAQSNEFAPFNIEHNIDRAPGHY
jgi:hypothetical protein